MKAAIITLAILGCSITGYGRVLETPRGPDFHSVNTSTSLHSNGTGVKATSSGEPHHAFLPDLIQTAGFDPNDFASSAEVARYGAKGGFLRCLLPMSDQNAGQAWPVVPNRYPPSVSSPWKGTLESKRATTVPSGKVDRLTHRAPDDMRTWYWHEASYEQDNCYFGSNYEPHHMNHMSAAFQSLGLNIFPTSQGGHTTCYSVEHVDESMEDEDGEVPPDEQSYVVYGREYHATGGHYRFGINQIGGAIFAQMFSSPLASATENWGYTPDMHLLPQLRLGSDIVFAYWLRRHPNPRNLRYYIVNNVLNHETLRLLATVLRNKGYRNNLPYWPGLQLDFGSPEFDMLLGSPLGATPAFLLIQHKAELGVKYVTSITVFQDELQEDTWNLPHMLFRIADVAYPVGGSVAARDKKRVVSVEGVDEKMSEAFVGGVRTHKLRW